MATVLWILAALVSLPYCYFMKLEQYAGYCGQFCTERWPDQNIRRGYSLILLCCQFLIPFTTMSCCYSAIFSRLKERANSKIKKLDERSQLLNTAIAGTPVLERDRVIQLKFLISSFNYFPESQPVKFKRTFIRRQANSSTSFKTAKNNNNFSIYGTDFWSFLVTTKCYHFDN